MHANIFRIVNTHTMTTPAATAAVKQPTNKAKSEKEQEQAKREITLKIHIKQDK